jgi:hypothetical protein
MKSKEPGRKENRGIQNNGIENSQENVIVDQRQVLKIFGGLHYRALRSSSRPENLKIETEGEVNQKRKGPYIV